MFQQREVMFPIESSLPKKRISEAGEWTKLTESLASSANNLQKLHHSLRSSLNGGQWTLMNPSTTFALEKSDFSKKSALFFNWKEWERRPNFSHVTSMKKFFSVGKVHNFSLGNWYRFTAKARIFHQELLSNFTEKWEHWIMRRKHYLHTEFWTTILPMMNLFKRDTSF